MKRSLVAPGSLPFALIAPRISYADERNFSSLVLELHMDQKCVDENNIENHVCADSSSYYYGKPNSLNYAMSLFLHIDNQLRANRLQTRRLTGDFGKIFNHLPSASKQCIFTSHTK